MYNTSTPPQAASSNPSPKRDSPQRPMSFLYDDIVAVRDDNASSLPVAMPQGYDQIIAVREEATKSTVARPFFYDSIAAVPGRAEDALPRTGSIRISVAPAAEAAPPQPARIVSSSEQRVSCWL